MEIIVYSAESDCSELYINVKYIAIDSKGTILKHKSFKIDYNRDFCESENISDIPESILLDLYSEGINFTNYQIIKL